VGRSLPPSEKTIGYPSARKKKVMLLFTGQQKEGKNRTGRMEGDDIAYPKTRPSYVRKKGLTPLFFSGIQPERVRQLRKEKNHDIIGVFSNEYLIPNFKKENGKKGKKTQRFWTESINERKNEEAGETTMSLQTKEGLGGKRPHTNPSGVKSETRASRKKKKNGYFPQKTCRPKGKAGPETQRKGCG